MKTPLVWQSDEDKAYNLNGPTGGLFWILPRQPYCDRGHWELGALGVSLPVSPSLYFHHFEVAQREAELWLAKSMGRPLSERPARCPDTWDVMATDVWVRRATQGDHPVECHLTRTGPANDRLWTWTIPVGLDAHPDRLDASDAFPRHFLRAEHAVREMEAFLRWRLEKIPTVVPGKIHRPDEPVSEVLREQLSRPLSTEVTAVRQSRQRRP
jgi:hypothetical protein